MASSLPPVNLNQVSNLLLGATPFISAPLPDLTFQGIAGPNGSGALFTFDMSGYNSLAVTIGGGNSTAIFEFYGSNDLYSPAWEPLPCELAAAAYEAVLNTFIPPNGISLTFVVQKRTRYVKFNLNQSSSVPSRWVAVASSAPLALRHKNNVPSSFSYACPSGGLTTAGQVAIVAAGAPWARRYLSSIQLSNLGSGTSEVQILDGSNVIWRTGVTASMPPTEFMFEPRLATSSGTGNALNFNVVSGTNIQIYASAQGVNGL